MSRYDAFPLRPDRLVWRFRKSGRDGARTRPFVEFDETLRREVLSRLGVRADEEPVLAFIAGADHWTVLTTRRLAWIEGGTRRDVPLHGIAGARLDAEALAAAGGKAQLRHLVVVTKSGAQHSVELDPGAPLVGFLNVLLTVARAMSEYESPAPSGREDYAPGHSTDEPTLPEPWIRVTSGAALGRQLLAELQRELAPGHSIYGRQAHAIARCCGCDEVVFALEENGTFALVHLTWSGHPDVPPWPHTTVLPTFLALELAVSSHAH
jgi:hypothetical protein